MKIGIIAPLEEAVSTTRFGGTERIIGHIADGLVAKGHEVVLYATADSETTAQLVPMADESILHQSQRDKDSLYGSYFLQLLNDAPKVDVWSNHILSYPLSFAAQLAAPMVTTVHSESIPSRLALMQAASKHSSFVAISEDQRQSYPDVRFAGMVYNGTDPDLLPLGNGGGNYFAWLGRFTAKKGAAEAVQVAVRTGSALKLAGELPDDPSTPDYQYFEECIKPYLSEQIEFIGRVDVDSKAAFLGEATALISPLSWEEPFGLVAVEAMSCGTPVITTKRGAMPELIRNGETGFLVDDPRDMDPHLGAVAALDRTAIRQHVIDSFSVAKMVDGYQRIYQERSA